MKDMGQITASTALKPLCSTLIFSLSLVMVSIYRQAIFCQQRNWCPIRVLPFATLVKESPDVVGSYYDKRIVGCPGGEGEDEHDVVWRKASHMSAQCARSTLCNVDFDESGLLQNASWQQVAAPPVRTHTKEELYILMDHWDYMKLKGRIKWGGWQSTDFSSRTFASDSWLLLLSVQKAHLYKGKRSGSERQGKCKPIILAQE